jgi:MoCo/4Fe-4S cofactor protein with predicted Tat translocation signal
MASHKTYWKSEAELSEKDQAVSYLKHNEFAETLPVNDFLEDEASLQSSETSRRDFLKYVGFSTAAVTLAACEGPVKKSIPYVIQPDEIVPGVANYYATTISDGFDFASILVKTREGRPIKIENNDRAKLFGGANARVQASVLNLYDKFRLQGPLAAGTDVSWDTLDNAVKARLDALSSTGQKAVILSASTSSHSYKALVAELKESYPFVEHVSYDAVSSGAAIEAYSKVYGENGLADYDFSKAM